MPDFAYIAIGKDGHHEEAVISAPDATSAGHLLKEQGLLATSLVEKGGKTLPILSFSLKRVSLAEKITFIENLSVMLKAGIPVSRSLQIIGKQTQNKYFQSVLSDVSTLVESGKGLGEALSKYGKIFSNIFISMIKVGELSGNLDKALEYLSVQLQREANLKSKVKGAMMYPSVIVFAIVVIGILMSIFVLPSLTSIFKESNMSLPITTQIVVAFSDFMSSHGLLAVLGLIGFVFAFASFMRTPGGQKSLDWFLLRMYVINKIVQKINLARLSRILSSLLKSGIPIVEALDVASESLGNTYFREAVAIAATDVKLGKPLSESLNKNPKLFPALTVQMLQVGEESGTVENILEQLAVHFEEQVDNVLTNLSSIIEPLLLLVIGAVVGLLAVALISPIYSMQTAQ